MIFTLLLTGLLTPVMWIFNLLPDFPDMPTVINGGASWIFTQIAAVNSLMIYIFSPTLWAAIWTVLIGLYTAEFGFWIIRFIWGKIPWVGANS